MIYEVTLGEKTYRVELTRAGEQWKCRLDGRELPVDIVYGQNGVLSLLLGGKSYEVKQETVGAEMHVVVGHERFNASVRDPRSFRSRSRVGAAEQGVMKIKAPMPGKVVRVLAGVGTQVELGQSVIVIEAMKMQNELKAPKNGVVKKINVAEGAAVDAGQALAEVE
ncbi:MAG TPA: biotin/lipoyl-containing protein [Candidatus Polarisedimenticolia bacterium]|jgi:biotin carboxyl carrier protein|nr:biotin/lipoyl-containing protein [Candidatus Polarisedimenticolia bacterium]